MGKMRSYPRDNWPITVNVRNLRSMDLFIIRENYSGIFFSIVKNETILKTMEGFQKNKRIPEKYKEVILEALSHYPELKNARIDFRLTKHASVPYGTKPSIFTWHKSANKRKCIIQLLEKAKGPTEKALFKNLSRTAQLGVIGHELNHVIQFNNCSRAKLMLLLISYLFPESKKILERAADIATIKHGLGMELYVHAIYIRAIPGYLEERKEINEYYLKPDEIWQRISDNGAGLDQPQKR
jgi:hypothetical protein